MTFPSDKLLSDYRVGAGISLNGVFSITLTVIYYENTTNFMFKINGSNPMAQFMVISDRMDPE